jgi:hypothetical protein
MNLMSLGLMPELAANDTDRKLIKDAFYNDDPKNPVSDKMIALLNHERVIDVLRKFYPVRGTEAPRRLADRIEYECRRYR